MVRDGGPAPDYEDIKLTDYIRLAAKTLNLDYLELPEDDRDLDCLVSDMVDEGVETPEGILGTLHTAAWAFAELRERLKLYEDSGFGPKTIAAIGWIGREVWVLALDAESGEAKIRPANMLGVYFDGVVGPPIRVKADLMDINSPGHTIFSRDLEDVYLTMDDAAAAFETWKIKQKSGEYLFLNHRIEELTAGKEDSGT